MLKSYLLITFRNMMKHKFFLFINISGLAIAIASCLVAYYLYEFNATFDGNHQQRETIYRVSSFREFQGEVTKYGHVPLALGNMIRQNEAGANKVIRYTSAMLTLRIERDNFLESVAYVDASFFEVFSFDASHGHLSVSEKSALVISDELAFKFFGKENPIGRTVSQIAEGRTVTDFTVVGTFKKQPNNSSFGQQAYVHFDNQFGASSLTENDWTARATLFVQVSDPEKALQLTNSLQPYVRNNNEVREDFIIKRFSLDPLPGLATSDSYNNVRGVWTNNAAHISAIMGTGIMGIFILLIACFNLTNTAIAISSGRLKELGIRKIMGSTRKHLIMQYIGETWTLCLFALLLGFIVANTLLIPAFNSLWPFWSYTPDYLGKPNFIVFMLLVLLITSMLAGSYPALYISKFEPTQILKGKVKFGGTNFFTRTLLTMQLVISLIAIVCSLAFIDNARYQKELDLGFNQKEVVFTDLENSGDYEIFRNRLLELNDITAVSGSFHHINASYFSDPITCEGKEIEADILDVGDHYVKTVGITLLEGRDFILDSETDKRESVLITENMAAAFGWNESLGKELIWKDSIHYRVIGVVKNIVNKGLMSRMDPVLLRYREDHDYKFILASAPIESITEVKAEMERVAKELFPDKIVTIRYMDELVARSIQINSSILKMFIFLGVIALLLSATGLYTLVSLNMMKRLKEIGIRKILGASGGNITRIINKEFVIILGLASAFGGYLGSFLSGMLLDSIWEHFQRTSLLTILLSILTLLIVSGLSISYKIISTIRINPTTILRNE